MTTGDKYINTSTNCIFVKGAKRAVLYNTKDHKIYQLNEYLTKILSLSQKQMTLDDIYYHLKGNKGIKEKLIKAVLEHPFLKLSQDPTPFLEVKRLKPICKPDFLWLELTRRCNLRCVHCYAEAGADIEESCLSTNDYKRVIEEASYLGFKNIQFTGGEATLYPDLLELLKHAKRFGYEFIELYTNAVNLSHSLLNFIAQNKINIATSFYSYKKETHDRITQRKGSFERTVENIKKILRLKIPLRVGIIRLKYNQDHIQKTEEFLVDLGVTAESIGIDTVRPSGRGCNLELMPDDKKDFFQEPEHHYVKYNGNDFVIPGTCWNGKIAITPSGDVIPCVFARDLVVGNVIKSSLKDIINSRKLKDLWEITLDDVEVCKDCEYRYACFDCRALPYSITKNLFARSPNCNYDPYTGQWNVSNPEEVSIMQIKEDYRPVRNKEISTKVIDGETILFNTQTNALHALNMVASEIWNRCDGKHSLEDIVDSLFDQFEASRDQIEEDVKKTLLQFQELGLIKL